MQCFVTNVGNVIKFMCHLFQTDVPYMYHACEIEVLELSLFWTVSEWAIKCDICDEPRVGTRF
jgi:hypothetical protein